MQPEESSEKIGYGKEIWKRRVAERREEDKEENGGQRSYRDSNSVKDLRCRRYKMGQKCWRKEENKIPTYGQIAASFLETARGFHQIIKRVLIGFQSEFQ